MNTAERTVHLLQSLLSRRERDRAVVRPARMIGRHEDGTERLQRRDATCPTRGGRDNHYTGTIVLSPASSLHRQGTTGQGTSETIPTPTLWIESLDPSTYHPGQTLTVQVTGRGFDAATAIDFLDPNPAAPEGTVNPDLEILAITIIDPELLLLELAVSPSARPLTNAPIAYGRAQ
jgi:hypothetical protein